jgi:hypothetical protein
MFRRSRTRSETGRQRRYWTHRRVCWRSFQWIHLYPIAISAAGASNVGFDLNVRLFVSSLEVVVAMYEAAHMRYVELHDRLNEWGTVAQGLPTLP